MTTTKVSKVMARTSKNQTAFAGCFSLADQAWTALGGDPVLLSALSFTVDGALPSAFQVSDYRANRLGRGETAEAARTDRRRGDGVGQSGVRPGVRFARMARGGRVIAR
jgi:hypothetical protein